MKCQFSQVAAQSGPASRRWFENIGEFLQKGEDSVDDRIEYQYNRQGQ